MSGRLIPQGVEHSGFRSEDIIGAAVGILALAFGEGTDAVWITEYHHAAVHNHSYHRVSSAGAIKHFLHRVADLIKKGQTVSVSSGMIQSVGEDVEDDLNIHRRVDVPAISFRNLLYQIGVVYQVTVVGHGDAVRDGCHDRLGLLDTEPSHSRIAGVTDTYFA